MGLPLGESAVAEPMAVARLMQLVWLQYLANSTGVAGTVHRAIAWSDGAWREPSPALRSALSALGWRVRRNLECARAQHWPALVPELAYPGPILLEPHDSFPLPGALFTDGSFSPSGGAAVWAPDTEGVVTRSVPHARSSTHCEMVALCLAIQARPTQVLTDSLCSLQLLQRWHAWPLSRQLLCEHRAEVRQALPVPVYLPRRWFCK